MRVSFSLNADPNLGLRFQFRRVTALGRAALILSFPLSFLVGLMPYSSAEAAIPPSRYLVQMMTQKRSRVRTLRVVNQVKAVGETTEGPAWQFKETTLFFPQTGTLRSLVSDEQGRVLFVWERPGFLTNPALSILFSTDLQTLTRQMKELGIPVLTQEELRVHPSPETKREAEVTGINRFERRIAWTIGKGNQQLWLEKDSFLPMRLITAKPSIDVVYDGMKVLKEIAVPRVSVLHNEKGKPWARSELVEARANLDANELAQAQGAGAGQEPGFTELGKALPNSTRNAIERYLKTLR